MSLAFKPAVGPLADLSLLRIEISDGVGHVRLNRPEKRNAVNDALVRQLQAAMFGMPQGIGAIVLSGEGTHFCAGSTCRNSRNRALPKA